MGSEYKKVFEENLSDILKGSIEGWAWNFAFYDDLNYFCAYCTIGLKRKK